MYEVDAFNEAIVKAATFGGRIILEPGDYTCNISLPNGTKGLLLQGSGKDKTFLRSNVRNQPVLQCNGMWFSHISNLSLGTLHPNDENAVVDIDGADNGHGHGIQGNKFSDVAFDGRGAFTNEKSNVVFALSRTAQGAGQGDTNTFLDCHFYGAKKALMYAIGYNCLNNQFIGGNCQMYDRCALEMVFGSFHVFGMAFQSRSGIQQILNGGYDILAEGGGVNDHLSINGCRTESLRFIKTNVAQPPLITNCNQAPDVWAWYPNMEYKVNDAVACDYQLYKCVSQHTAGTNRMADLANTELWEHVIFDAVNAVVGAVINSTFTMGNVAIYHDIMNPVAQVPSVKKEITTYQMTPDVKVITVDADNGPIVVKLYNPQAVPIGTEVEVIRADHPVKGAEFSVEIHSLYFNNKNVHMESLPTVRRVARYRAIGGGSFPRRWYTVGGLPASRFVN